MTRAELLAELNSDGLQAMGRHALRVLKRCGVVKVAAPSGSRRHRAVIHLDEGDVSGQPGIEQVVSLLMDRVEQAAERAARAIAAEWPHNRITGVHVAKDDQGVGPAFRLEVTEAVR